MRLFSSVEFAIPASKIERQILNVGVGIGVGIAIGIAIECNIRIPTTIATPIPIPIPSLFTRVGAPPAHQRRFRKQPVEASREALRRLRSLRIRKAAELPRQLPTFHAIGSLSQA
jgi:hypothetical protein